MDDLATVRAQIKNWERSFKEKHGRPPTVNDIKENHHIGQFLQTLNQLLLTAIQLKNINSTRSSLKQLVYHKTRLRRSLRTRHPLRPQERHVQRSLLLSSYLNRVLFNRLHL